MSNFIDDRIGHSKSCFFKYYYWLIVLLLLINDCNRTFSRTFRPIRIINHFTPRSHNWSVVNATCSVVTVISDNGVVQSQENLAVDQRIAAYNALIRRNIPAKLVLFPDEGHGYKKRNNAKRWYEIMISWMDKHAE